MKVGILTWFSACNYGARAHCLALYKTVLELGHECVMVCYHPKKENRINFYSNVGINHIYLHPIRMLKAYIRCNKFKKAVELTKTTKQVYSAKEIDELGLDVIILGSDEVFNADHLLFEPIYYGVGIINTPIITYAPSSGQCNINKELSNEIKNSLKKMIKVSTRDQHTAELIKNNTGIDAEIVADPTILYEFEEEMIRPQIENYLLIYAFESFNEYEQQIKEYSKEKNIIIVSLGQYRNWADVNYDLASVQEWFGVFKNANCVITDSFHGVVFATKYNKQFVIIGRPDKLNKINDFLSIAGINRDYYDGTISIREYMKNEIDFKKAHNNLELLKIKSINYLNDGISLAGKERTK